jgi:hypothetical protein
MSYTTKIVRLASSTPLPCSTYNAERDAPCGKPAYAAYAYEKEDDMPPLQGRWILQPVCQECANKAAKVYGE